MRPQRPALGPKLLVGTCLLLMWACGPTVPAPELEADGAVRRFIRADPGRLFDLESLYENPPLATWSLDEEAEWSSWTGQEGDPKVELTATGLKVLPGEGATTLRRRVALRADDVLHLEVEVEGLARGHLILAWRRADEDATSVAPAERRIQLRGSSGSGVGAKTYRFRLAQHQGWRGQIEELGLSVRPAPGETAVVRKMVAVGRRLRPEALQELADTATKVEIDHEVRDALVPLPGTPVERIFDASMGDELRWAYALEPESRAAVEFVLAAAVGRDTPVVIWRHRLDPRKGEAGRWFEARQPLSEFAGKRLRLVFETRVDQALEDLKGLPFLAHPAVVAAPSADPPLNVVLISVDTLRADHLSLYGYPRETSPHLDAWAARSAVVFERTVAAAPWTLPSHVSMFSGLDAVRHGVNHDVGQREAMLGEGRFDVLARILRRAGYRTAAITGGAYLHPSYGLTYGFERYRSWPDRGRARHELERGVERSLEFLEEHREAPFFLFLHTYDVHDPYVARRPFFERVAAPGVEPVPGEIALFSPAFEAESGFRQVNRFLLRHRGEKRFLEAKDRPLIEAFYDSGIAHMDAEIGRFLAGLEALGLAERTIVVLTSDHGEALGEEGHAGHVDLFDPVVLVPLLISWPERTVGGQRIGEQVRSIDIPATLLAGLGLDDHTSMDGVSLLDLMAGETTSAPTEAWTYAASSNRGLALRYGDAYKLMVENSVWQPGGEALYDLRKDPRELHPLGREEGPGEELRQRLESYFESHAVGLRLRLTNGGPGTLHGELEGAMVRPVATKSVNLPCPCVEWREMGRAAFEVPPGVSYTLHFEKIFGQQLRLRGALESADGRHRFDHTFVANELEGASVLRLQGGEWQRDGGRVPEGGTGFRIWWQGEQQEHGEAPSAQDSELRQQLEALGYL